MKIGIGVANFVSWYSQDQYGNLDKFLDIYYSNLPFGHRDGMRVSPGEGEMDKGVIGTGLA